MDRIRIRGGERLHGVVRLSGAKNAALPIMAASLLTDEALILQNVPMLADIRMMRTMLSELGVMLDPADGLALLAENKTLRLHARTITCTTAPYDLVRRMRASVLVLGPLVARTGEAVVSLPGGCAIGARPIDFHLDGLRAMGAQIAIREGYIRAVAPSGGLVGAHIRFPRVSVGATENILMAACLARGVTTIENAACEPEIVDLIECLASMGASIEWTGPSSLRITGRSHLHGTAHRVVADRIEAGTYAIAAALTDGEIILHGGNRSLIVNCLKALEPFALAVDSIAGGVRVRRSGKLCPIEMVTGTYPGFPTDLQAQLMTLATIAPGISCITETVFENRFMHVPELRRLGASISVDDAEARIVGVPKLLGANVMATDLRASVSLVLAGLVAEGETIVNRVYHLDRGYERIESKLSACGARIERLLASDDAEPASVVDEASEQRLIA